MWSKYSDRITHLNCQLSEVSRGISLPEDQNNQRSAKCSIIHASESYESAGVNLSVINPVKFRSTEKNCIFITKSKPWSAGNTEIEKWTDKSDGML